MKVAACFAIYLVIASLLQATALPTPGTVTQISSFAVPQSPSGLFYYATQDLLYVLCGTRTNGDHALYAFTTAGVQQCAITIPQAAGMSRVDGFYISGTSAYIVDSQGPIYAGTSGRLGGSIYRVDWSNPCGCTTAACASTTATWNPTVTKTFTISATDATIGDGGGNDQYFRNSGIVVTSDSFYAVNGVHPNPSLTCCYPKSLIKGSLAGIGTATQKWSFTASTVGRDVDMEGLTCGSDNCANYIYVGDEYNYIYKMNLATADPAAAVEVEWNARSIAGSVPDDKGFEALTYASTTGHFYAGVQETAMIHVLQLVDPTTGGTGSPSTATFSPGIPPTPVPPVPVVTPSTSGVGQTSLCTLMTIMLIAGAMALI